MNLLQEMLVASGYQLNTYVIRMFLVSNFSHLFVYRLQWDVLVVDDLMQTPYCNVS